MQVQGASYEMHIGKTNILKLFNRPQNLFCFFNFFDLEIGLQMINRD